MAGRYRPLPMPSSGDQGDRTVTPPRKLPAGKIYFGTELYIWGLADWGPPENLVPEFKPAAELTLAAYNEIADSNTAVLALKRTDRPVVLLAGFGETSLEEAGHLYRQAKGSLKNVYKEPTNRELLEGMSRRFDIVRTPGVWIPMRWCGGCCSWAMPRRKGGSRRPTGTLEPACLLAGLGLSCKGGWANSVEDGPP